MNLKQKAAKSNHKVVNAQNSAVIKYTFINKVWRDNSPLLSHIDQQNKHSVISLASSKFSYLSPKFIVIDTSVLFNIKTAR